MDLTACCLELVVRFGSLVVPESSLGRNHFFALVNNRPPMVNQKATSAHFGTILRESSIRWPQLNTINCVAAHTVERERLLVHVVQ